MRRAYCKEASKNATVKNTGPSCFTRMETVTQTMASTGTEAEDALMAFAESQIGSIPLGRQCFSSDPKLRHTETIGKFL